MKALRQPGVFAVGGLLLVGAVLAGCTSDNPAGPTFGVPFSITDIVVGTGAAAAIGNTLTVEFTGWLYDPSQPENKGTMFDATNGSPFPFVLGVGSVIAGWDNGLVGMRVGGQRRLVIPPNLGFGESGAGSIPPNATLLFEIELLSVQ